MTILTPYAMLPEVHTDERGVCTVFDSLPFLPVRQFFISNVPSDKSRGNHGHFFCWQAIQCVSGSVRLKTDGMLSRVWYLTPGKQIVVPPKYTISLYMFSEGAVVSVLASEPFDLGEVFPKVGAN